MYLYFLVFRPDISGKLISLQQVVSLVLVFSREISKTNKHLSYDLNTYLVILFAFQVCWRQTQINIIDEINIITFPKSLIIFEAWKQGYTMSVDHWFVVRKDAVVSLRASDSPVQNTLYHRARCLEAKDRCIFRWRDKIVDSCHKTVYLCYMRKKCKILACALKKREVSSIATGRFNQFSLNGSFCSLGYLFHFSLNNTITESDSIVKRLQTPISKLNAQSNIRNT